MARGDNLSVFPDCQDLDHLPSNVPMMSASVLTVFSIGLTLLGEPKLGLLRRPVTEPTLALGLRHRGIALRTWKERLLH